METLENQQKSPATTTTVARSAKKNNNATVSFPNEIIEAIFLRLPVRSILRFRSLSKPWLNRISHPSFTNLHLTHNTQTPTPRTSLFISAHHKPTHQLHLLSAPHDGGPLTHLITLHDPSYSPTTQSHYLNGLIFFSNTLRSTHILNPTTHTSFVINPSTHTTFKLPDPPLLTDGLYQNTHICYLFGFDETRNEHQVVNIRMPHGPEPVMYNTVEVMIFSMSTYSCRKIDAMLPVDCGSGSLCSYDKGSVCVDSVVHLLLRGSFDILAYDLRTNEFSVISAPEGVVPGEDETEMYTRDGETHVKGNNPRIVKMGKCVGVVCHDRVVESNEMVIWVYENRVWVREVVRFPKAWVELDCPFPLDGVGGEEIMFSSSFVSVDRVRLYVYNRTDGCFKELPFSLGRHPLCASTMELREINCYVETMLPL